MTKKRMYEQPRTHVVELRVMNQLLANSVTGTANTVQHEGFVFGDDDMWGL